ncbi:type IV pilus modification protein PilV [Rhodanobacter sp. BL-MT-08]
MAAPGLPAGARCRHSGRLNMRQSGVGLIEVLVAVLVLSIAFLGVAALQAVSLSTSNSAMARSMATIASYSILDAMRADTANAEAGKYNEAGMSTNSCPTTVDTLANAQIGQWCQQLAANLGTSSNTIGMISCQANGNCTVTVQFDDSRSGSGGSNVQKVVTVASL